VTRPRFTSELRTAWLAGAVFGLCQMLLEIGWITIRTWRFITAPFSLVETEMYDYSVKLVSALPGGDGWFHGGYLDRFLPAGGAPKLALISGLLVPNLLAAAFLGFSIGISFWLCKRVLTESRSLCCFLVVAGSVQVVSATVATHLPKNWTWTILARNVGRTLVWDGAYVAFSVIALAGVATWAILRRGPRGRAAAVVTLITVASILLAVGWRAQSALGAPRVEQHVVQEFPVTTADNVILISIDSLRADHLGCYGNQRPTSPALDALAAAGSRFSEVSSPTSWTLPSHMSMLTGRSLLSHGVITQNDRLPDSIPTLSETLRRAGMATGGIVSGLFLKGYYGFARGFQHYDDFSVVPEHWYEERSTEPAGKVADLAIQWLRAQAAPRFFLFLHFWDVHYDYLPPVPYDTMFDPDYRGTVSSADFLHNPAIHKGMATQDLAHILALYDGEIRWVDDQISRVLAVLQELGLENSTLVVVTADHGDEFFEHGHKGHQRTLYREVLHVPLILKGPGVPRGRTFDLPVGLVDVMPTILDLVHVTQPADMDGRSLLPFFVGATDENRVLDGWLCDLTRRRGCQASRTSGVGTVIHRFQPLKVEFYATDDKAEHRDLGATSSWPREEQLSLLASDLRAKWTRFLDLGTRRGTVRIDPLTLQRIHELGY
jgi:hypothetical protein